MKIEIEGHRTRGCFLVFTDLLRAVLDGRSDSVYGIWIEDKLYGKMKSSLAKP